MPEVLTAAELERKQSVVVKKKISVAVEQEAATEPVLPAAIYHLQDPDLKTFEDDIVLNGKRIHRSCFNGSLQTTDKDLVDFQVRKGYILVHTEEAENGEGSFRQKAEGTGSRGAVGRAAGGR